MEQKCFALLVKMIYSSTSTVCLIKIHSLKSLYTAANHMFVSAIYTISLSVCMQPCLLEMMDLTFLTPRYKLSAR